MKTAVARRLLSAQLWGFASSSELQVAPRKHSRIYALHLKRSQAKPSFFLYDRLCRRAEVVLVFFFWRSLLLFLSLRNLVKSKLRLVWKKKKRRDTYLHFWMLHRLFSRTSSSSPSVSLTSHSSWIQDRNSEIRLLRHYDIQKTAFSSWPLLFSLFPSWTWLNMEKKREKRDGISQCLDTRTTTSD